MFAIEPENTAVRVALWRALHVQADPPPHVFTDEVGLQLVAPDPGWQQRPDMSPFTRPFRASIVARARFVEDLVEAQAAAQYVILGAGLDTFAQRKPALASRMHVFEIDQPGPQAWKRQRLVAAGFDTRAPAVVASTGVSMYLTRDAIAATLRQVAALAAGSTLISRRRARVGRRARRPLLRRSRRRPAPAEQLGRARCRAHVAPCHIAGVSSVMHGEAPMDPRSTKFDETRQHLHDVAYRMLGSAAEADDAVQETWLKFHRADLDEVHNLGGWLTTVTARVCLDMLRARKSRDALPAKLPVAAVPDAARDALLADSVAHALLVVLETLSPAERVAFVLHDMFDVSFEEIGRVLERSEAATRQLASRARRRVQRRDTDAEAGRAERGVVDAFLAAAREGDFDALLAVLHPDVVVRADALAVRTATANKKWSSEHPLAHETRGAHAVASLFKGRAGAAVPALVDGEAGAAWVVHGRVRSAFVFVIEHGRVVSLDLVMEPDALAELDIHQLRSPGT